MPEALPPPMGQAFAGDGLLEDEIERLAARHGIVTAVETGTHQGVTARALAALVPAVHTIESDRELHADAARRLAGVPNVQLHLGSSPAVLEELLPRIIRPALYYLDAHWGGSYPLPAELAAIARHDPRPVIVMHDMQVPGHPEFHWDPREDGSPYCYEWVRPVLETIRGPWRHYWNEAARGLQVGVLFVVPAGGP